MSNFPSRCARTSEQLLAPEPDDLLVVAAAGDNVAVAERWLTSVVDHRLFVSADAGETWDVVPVDAGNQRLLSVIDERLVFAGSIDDYYGVLFVSNSASDWSRLEEIEDRTRFGVGEPRRIQRRPTWSRLALQLPESPIDLQHGSERLVVDPQPPRRTETSP